MTPSQKAQAEAQKKIGYGQITLRREGEYAVVEIEVNGESHVVIRELYGNNFYHSVYPLGMVEDLERAGVSL